MSNIKAKRLADIQKITNKNPHWNALECYSHVRVQGEDGEEYSLLFTDKEIARAKDRASKNTEDLPKVSWLRDMLD
jgi:hypothetical protein